MTVTVFLDNAEQAKNLVNYLNKFSNDFDIDSGYNVVDGKSFMGVVATCIGRECVIYVRGDISTINEFEFRDSIKNIVGGTI